MIRILNLCKAFGKLKAMDNISVLLGEGECIALIGPNGCGKTTLIKSILGMVVPDSGNIWFDNEPVKRDYRYRTHIGYMPQIGRFPQHMTIGNVLDMVKNIRIDPPRIDTELIDAFGLEGMKDKRMGTLSGGTIQKVSAALAFLFDPKVLILDEPTAGLDPLASELLKDKIFKEKERGKLILITSHLLSELDGMVDRILFMEEGRISLFVSVNELLETSGESTIAKGITHYLKKKVYEPNY